MRRRMREKAISRAKAAPTWVKGPAARAVRPFRRHFSGPLVTVVVPVSDDDTTRIGPCLDSLRGQTYDNLDILVVPFGRSARVREIAAAHTEDWRVRVRRRNEDTLAAARNAGAKAARGELLNFVAGGDSMLPRGIGRLVGGHEATGSPLIVGQIKEPLAVAFQAEAPYETAHHDDVRRTTLTDQPVAITDLGIGNKLFTAHFWKNSGLAFTDDLPTGEDLAIAAYQAAECFDLLREATYVPDGRKDGVGIGTMPDILSTMPQWLNRQTRIWKHIEPIADAEIRNWWLWGVLDTTVQPLISDVERASDSDWTALRDAVHPFLDASDGALWAMLRAESRVKLWLLDNDRREELAEFAAGRLFTGESVPTEVRDGKVWAHLPFHDDDAVGVPAEHFEMSAVETRLRAAIWDLDWPEPERVELTIAAAIDQVHLTEAPRLECALVEQQSGRRIDLPVVPVRDHRANVGGRRHQDFSWGAFTTTVPVDELVAATEGVTRTWTFEVGVAVDGLERRGTIGEIADRGTAALFATPHLSPRAVGTAHVSLTPRATAPGFRIAPATLPALLHLTSEGREVRGQISAGGLDLLSIRCQEDERRVEADLTAADDALAFRMTLPPTTHERPWRLRAVAADGSQYDVQWPGRPERWLGSGEVVAACTSEGTAELVESGGRFVAESLHSDGFDLDIVGRWLGPTPPGSPTFELSDLMGTIESTSVEQRDDGEVVAHFRLTNDRWGLGERGTWHGPRQLSVRAAGVTARGLIGERAAQRLGEETVGSAFAVRSIRDGQDFGVEIRRPQAADERGPYNQTRLQKWFHSDEIEIDEHTVYLQAYAGGSATDSQLAIHEELRRARPDLKLYWGVSGAESWVPDDGIPVMMNTGAWFHAMASAKYLCMNIDPERWFERRPGQQMLQTFHGYPAKSMGIRMWRAKHHTQRRIDLELKRTSGDWDLILTPAPEMDEHYRREYAYDGPILSEGYPRDDVLVSAAADTIREDTRRRLGIAPGQKAVLYAPTWRDDLATNWREAEIVQHLDLESASRALGPDYVLLMRGHRFHSQIATQRQAGTARLLDVTGYPEINDLILASDAAVLDYSSLRFDFALTGRPMIFLVPDLDDYVGGVRGFLYPFEESAPGPLVEDAREVVTLLRDLDGLQERYAAELAAFNATYNYKQDGRATQRVVDAFFR